MTLIFILAGALGIAIGVIVLLVAFMLSMKQDAMDAETANMQARSDEWLARVIRRQSGKKCYFKHEGRDVYCLEEDVYMSPPEIFVSSVSQTPTGIWNARKDIVEMVE